MTHAIARPQGARRQDRGGRHLQQRHDEAGRYQDHPAARHRRRVRLRRHARAVPRRLCRSRLSGALHRLPRANWKRISRPARRNGPRRSAACRSRRSRRSPAPSAQTKRSFFRLGYGFTRSRNGAAQMHAALCIPAVTGAWQYEGGGAFFNNAAIWKFDKIHDRGPRRASIRTTRLLDQSQDRAHPDRRSPRRCRAARRSRRC